MPIEQYNDIVGDIHQRAQKLLAEDKEFDSEYDDLIRKEAAVANEYLRKTEEDDTSHANENGDADKSEEDVQEDTDNDTDEKDDSKSQSDDAHMDFDALLDKFIQEQLEQADNEKDEDDEEDEDEDEEEEDD